jgi:hypothetical protein
LLIEGDGVDDAGRALDARQQLANWGVAGSMSQWHADQVREMALAGLIDLPTAPVPLSAGPAGMVDAATVAEVGARHRFRRRRAR